MTIVWARVGPYIFVERDRHVPPGRGKQVSTTLNSQRKIPILAQPQEGF